LGCQLLPPSKEHVVEKARRRQMAIRLSTA